MGYTEHTNEIRLKHIFILSLQEKMFTKLTCKMIKARIDVLIEKKKGRIGGAPAP